MNYKHLHYFMQVARCGGVARASELLHMSPQTVSGQVQLLEEALGNALLARSGRGLVLTEVGRLVLGYAETIFSAGAELEQAVREHPRKGRTLEFRVGVADVVPKSIACRLIEPATQLPQPVRIQCRESNIDSLLAELALHKLDLVISDAPLPSHISVRAFSHRLGASAMNFFATPALLANHAGAFPACLDGAPMLMPSEDSALGQRLRAWLQAQALEPRIVGEFDDSALAKAFGARGAGIFVGPSVLAHEIETQYGVGTLGVALDVMQEFFAISVQRQVTHPCVVAITHAARKDLFAAPGRAPRARRRGGGGHPSLRGHAASTRG